MIEKLKKSNYRLSDSVKFNKNYGCRKDSIGYKYIKTKKNTKLCYKTLCDIIDEDVHLLPNVLGVHIRVGDWLTTRSSSVIKAEKYEHLIKKHLDTLKKCEKCIIFYGTGSTPNQENQQKSEEYINKIKEIIINNLKIPIEFYHNDVDTDFIGMVSCEYFIVGMGGFSHLAGAVSKNTVFWEIAIQSGERHGKKADKNYCYKSYNYYHENFPHKCDIVQHLPFVG